MSNCHFVTSFPEYVLDRTIVISKGHEHRVSGYKLAKASEFFRNQLKEIRIKELEKFKQKGKDDLGTSPPPSSAAAPNRARTRSLSEIDNERIKVDYGDIFGLEYILSFIHCQEDRSTLNLKVTVDNARSILRAGLFFKVSSLIEFCFSEIEESVNNLNCWQYCAIAKELQGEYPQLDEFMDNYILENFASATDSEYFLLLNIKDLQAFLRNDLLNIKDEVNLLAVVDRWTEHNPSERLVMFPDLLECIRLGRLTPEELQMVSSNRFVLKTLKECNHLLTWARMPLADLEQNPPTLLGSRKQGDINSLIDYLHKPRSPREALVVVGGWEGNQDDPNFGPSKAIQVYDNRANVWKRIVGEKMGLDEGHAYSGCVLFKNRLYVIGGYVASGPTQTLKMYDLACGHWKYLSPMHEKRNYITSCLLDGLIYTIGGHNGRNRLSSVERYDPIQNHWSFVCPMRQVRSDAGCDSLSGRLYVCGGFDGHHFYASVEMYDPRADQWSSVAPMGNIRSGVSVITHRQHLFAIGGNDGLQRLRTVERFDPVANRWVAMPAMIRQRSNFCLAVLEDEIYVMGGWSDETNSTIALVEKWRPGLASHWQPVQQLFMPASANCCCTVKGVANVRDLFNQ